MNLPFIGGSKGYLALQRINFNNPHTTKNRYDIGKSIDFGLNRSIDANGMLQESFGVLGFTGDKARQSNNSIINIKPKRLNFQQK